MSEGVEVIRLGAQHVSLAGEDGDEITVGDRLEQGQHLPAERDAVNATSWFIGSSTTLSPRSSQSARVSERRNPRSGRATC